MAHHLKVALLWTTEVGSHIFILKQLLALIQYLVIPLSWFNKLKYQCTVLCIYGNTYKHRTIGYLMYIRFWLNTLISHWKKFTLCFNKLPYLRQHWYDIEFSFKNKYSAEIAAVIPSAHFGCESWSINSLFLYIVTYFLVNQNIKINLKEYLVV